MKRNVLHLTGSFLQGGSERQAVQLARLQAEDGTFNVFVGCLNAEGSLRAEVESFVVGEIPEFPLTSFYDLNFLRQVRRCIDFIRRNQIDIFQTHDFYSNVFGMAAATIARVPVRIASKRETFSKSKGQMFLERQSYRGAHKIIANAEAVKEFLTRTGVPSSKIVVIYNGVDLEQFSSARVKERGELARGLDLDIGQNQVVTIVANLRSDVKNHEMFLRVAQWVLRSKPETLFIVAGEGERMPYLKELADDLSIAGNVRFIGKCSDVAAILSLSDVCVLTSRSEGFSNAILEYMAAGKPVVATRVGGASEAVLHGETGYLVESDDAKTMGRFILELLSDHGRAASLGLRGRQRIETAFSKHRQVNSVSDLYSSLKDE